MKHPVKLFKGLCQVCLKWRPDCALCTSTIGIVQRRVDVHVISNVCLSCWKKNHKHYHFDQRHK